MNDKLVEALSKIRELDIEIAKVKAHLSDIVKFLDEESKLSSTQHHCKNQTSEF